MCLCIYWCIDLFNFFHWSFSLEVKNGTIMETFCCLSVCPSIKTFFLWIQWRYQFKINTKYEGPRSTQSKDIQPFMSYILTLANSYRIEMHRKHNRRTSTYQWQGRCWKSIGRCRGPDSVRTCTEKFAMLIPWIRFNYKESWGPESFSHLTSFLIYWISEQIYLWLYSHV